MFFPTRYTFDRSAPVARRMRRSGRLARENGCLLVTKDKDFHRLSILLAAPPKVVWIRRGNCSTNEIAQLLRENYADIQRFAERHEATFLALG